VALVVFLRGVNLGRHGRFLPAQLARDLAFEPNIGATGTFVVRAPVARTTVLRDPPMPRLRIRLIIVKGRSCRICARQPFGRHRPAQRTALCGDHAQTSSQGPDLPLIVPPNDDWQVKVVTVAGQLVASVWRHEPGMPRPLYPNAVIEKQFGVATTRNWNTVSTICKILQP
jgi:hypothetical protein